MYFSFKIEDLLLWINVCSRNISIQQCCLLLPLGIESFLKTETRGLFGMAGMIDLMMIKNIAVA